MERTVSRRANHLQVRTVHHAVLRALFRVLAGLVTVVMVITSLPGSAASASTPARLEVIGGTFHVRAGVTASLRIGASADPAFLAAVQQPATRIIVTASVPLVRRRDVSVVVRGATPEIDSTLELPIRSLNLEERDGVTAWRLNVPTSASRDDGRLALRTDGVRLLTVDVTTRDGVVARARTFLNVVGFRSSYTRLPVSMLASVTSGPTLQPDGTVVVNDGVRTELEKLRDLLFVVDDRFPVSVRITPELLDGLARTTDDVDSRLWRDLRELLQGSDILTNTYRSFEPTAAAAAKLDAQFIDQLQRGETVVAGQTGSSVVRRGMWVTDSVFDSRGARLLRKSGVNAVTVFGAGAESLGDLDNYVRPYRVSFDGTGLAVYSAEPRYAELLDTPIGGAFETAIAIVAELHAQRQEIAAAGGDTAVGTRQVILTGRSGLPTEPLVAGFVLNQLGRSPQVDVRGLSLAASALDGLTSITLPDVTPVDLTSVQAEINVLLTSIDEVSSMLAGDESMLESWLGRVDTANDTSLDANQRNAYLAAVNSEIGAIRNALRLPRASFTLGSRESDVRVALANDTAYDLSVRISFASSRMTFNRSTFDVTIPARGTSEVLVAVTARANGLLPIDMTLSTPTGSLIDSQRITVRVNALAGLGRGVSAAFLALLAVWWLVHLRRTRRKKMSRHHPALRS